jgi:hypothetical protein
MQPAMRAMTVVFILMATTASATGNPWTPIPTPPDPEGRLFERRTLLRSAFTSPTEGWAFGQNAKLGERPFEFDAFALRFNGSAWQEAPFPGASAPEMVSAPAANNVWVGVYPACDPGTGPAVRFDGSGWTVPEGPGCLTFASILAFAPDDVWGAGADHDEPLLEGWRPTPVLAHFDGVRWSKFPTGELGAAFQLSALGGVGPRDVWSMGTTVGGDVLALHFDGTRWSRVPVPIRTMPDNLHFRQVLAFAPDDVLAVAVFDNSSYFLHWDGASWSLEVVQGGGVEQVARNGSTLVAVGRRGQAQQYRPFLIRRFRGAWVEGTLPEFQRGWGQLNGISALPGSSAFVVTGAELGESHPELAWPPEVPFLAHYDPSQEPPPADAAVPPHPQPPPPMSPTADGGVPTYPEGTAAPREVDLPPARPGAAACTVGPAAAAPGGTAALWLLPIAAAAIRSRRCRRSRTC